MWSGTYVPFRLFARFSIVLAAKRVVAYPVTHAHFCLWPLLGWAVYAGKGSSQLIKSKLSFPANRTRELCESRGGRPGLPVLMSLMVSVDVK